MREKFYNHLKMENITDADYMHTKEFARILKKKLGEFHDLHFQSNTLLLADVFTIFRTYISNYMGLILLIFFSAPGLAWALVLKKNKVKINLLTDIDVLLMVEKVIRGGICHVIHQYGKVNTKYMKDYDKSK